MKQVLITGGSGFIGSHLAKKLKRDGHKVFIPDLEQLNFLKPDTILATISAESWDVVIHLAGMSHVVECEKNQPLADAINVKGTQILLGALEKSQADCHFIFASTAQVYRAPHNTEIRDGVVFAENREVVPQNFYANTKLEGETLVTNSNFRSSILRLFNHTHKSQAPTFFLPHIYQQLKSGVRQIPVGNLDLERDIGSIQDLITAFTSVINGPDSFQNIFNVCSGRGKNLRKLAELLAKKLNPKAQFVLDETRVRIGEPLKIVGSHGKLSSALGWEPTALTEEDLIESFLCE